MNGEQLRNVLMRKGFNETLYSIGELASHSESYSIVRDGGLWKVVYKERGAFNDIESGLSEEQACDLVYNMFREIFGWPDEGRE